MLEKSAAESNMDYKSFFWVGLFLQLGLSATFAVCDPVGFLSLSCGAQSTSVDPTSNITWLPDMAYVTTTSSDTASVDLTQEEGGRVPIRFFPTSKGDGRRNCYRLPVNNASLALLIRATFAYKNYDGLGNPPTFSVSLGTATAATVNLSASDPITEEFIWPVVNDGDTAVSVCLCSIPEGGHPVISSLQVRPLPPGAYANGTLLRKRHRINSGESNATLRYPLDPYDRIWDVDQKFSPAHKSSPYRGPQLVLDTSSIHESPPLSVLQTARFLAQGDAMSYILPLDKIRGGRDYYVGLYFAGVLPVTPTFDIVINGDLVWSNYTVPISGGGGGGGANFLFFKPKQVHSTTMNITFKKVMFYPQVNAIEVYEVIDIPPETSSNTVSALQVIQQFAGVDLDWEGDPCRPVPWNRIGCAGSVVTSLELSGTSLQSISPAFGDLLDLKTLDLHNTSLAGQILNLGSLQHLETLNLSFNWLTSFGTELEELISLQILDLKNNSLQEFVPESLGKLQNLRFLNLENNDLQGTLPQSLNRDNLEVRTSGNLCLESSTETCNRAPSNLSIEEPQVSVINKQKHNSHTRLGVTLGVVLGALLALILITTAVLSYMTKKTKQRSIDMYRAKAMSEMYHWGAARIFSYREIKAAANNFKEAIGRGSFGPVYLGKLPDGKLVAVKVRFDRSQLGAECFVNEVHLLSQIRHQNLVSLEGFCYETKQQILVYEYLAGGSLADKLYGRGSKSVKLSWVRRLKIALDAAKGLDYLHNGTSPKIIHRDVKSTNILLDSEMNAKVCDFGLSKQVTRADATHVTTVVKGTAGYLDPEYYTTQQLTEKSDVYSFGVVLLELICGREPLDHSGSPDSFNLVLWARPYLQAGAFEIVDECIKGSFDMESMTKAAMIAARAVERDASQRPSMAQVLAKLKEAYRIQLSYLASHGHGS